MADRFIEFTDVLGLRWHRGDHEAPEPHDHDFDSYRPSMSNEPALAARAAVIHRLRCIRQAEPRRVLDG